MGNKKKSKKPKSKDVVLNLEDSTNMEKLLEEYGVIFEPLVEESEPPSSIPRPDSIRIFGRVYNISYLPYSIGLQSCGSTNHPNLLMVIQEDQLPIEEADTLLHEVIHGIEYTMDLKLSEHQIRALATGLLGVLRDNPVFAKYIVEDSSQASTPSQVE